MGGSDGAVYVGGPDGAFVVIVHRRGQMVSQTVHDLGKGQPHRGHFHDREGFGTGSGTKPFVIMVDARNVSMLGSDITGHNGIGSRQVAARVKAANRFPRLEVAQLLRLWQVALLRSGVAEVSGRSSRRRRGWSGR